MNKISISTWFVCFAGYEAFRRQEGRAAGSQGPGPVQRHQRQPHGRPRLQVGERGRFSFHILIIFSISPLRITPHSRSKDIVEPLMKPQWYVSCSDMGKQAADAVREGRLKIIPDHHLKTWFNWMDNIR